MEQTLEEISILSGATQAKITLVSPIGARNSYLKARIVKIA